MSCGCSFRQARSGWQACSDISSFEGKDWRILRALKCCPALPILPWRAVRNSQASTVSKSRRCRSQAIRCPRSRFGLVASLRLKHGSIRSLSIPRGKRAVEFDDIPYRNPGAEHPRSKVHVGLDLNHEVSIDGHVDLEREKFCRYYAAPGNLHTGFERWALGRNFLPGRQIFKLQSALVIGYSKNQPRLSESRDKPGAADLSFFDRDDSSGTTPNAIPEFQDIKFAMCFNDYPEFMSVKEVGAERR